MGYIRITSIDVGATSSNTVVTVSYKLASLPDIPGNYTIFSNSVVVMPNDQIVGGPITIGGLLDDTLYTVKIMVNCSGSSVQEDILTSLDPAITTTTSTSTSTSTSTTSSTSSTTTTSTTQTPPVIQWEYQELGGADGTATITSGPNGVEDFRIFSSSTNSGIFSIFVGNKLYIAAAAQSSTNVPNYYYIAVTNVTNGILIYDVSSTTPINYLSPALPGNKTYKVLVVTNLIFGTTSTTTTSSTTGNPATSTTSTTSTTKLTTTTSTTSSSTTTTSTTVATTTTSTSTSTTTSTTSSTTTSTTTKPCPPITGFETDGSGTTTSTTSTSTSSSTTTTTTTLLVTTSTSTTSTSSSTTTTTSTASFLTLVRYGVLSDGDTPTEAEILAGSFINQNVSGNINLNWGPMASVPTFYWFAVPNIHPNANKNYFFQATDNQGPFDPDGLFRLVSTVVVSGVTHYVTITNYATLFINTDYIFSKV